MSLSAQPPPVIHVENLTRTFGSFVAVDHVSFDVFPSEILGYLGANGAGKSTTIRMLCGLLAPTSGAATVAGVDVAHKPERVKHAIGYMSQKFSLYMDLHVEENLEFFGGAYGLGGKKLAQRASEVLHAVNLWEQRRAMTGSLPAGWRQRLALACAILHKPSILFLDEPTAGVDPVSRRNFWKLVRSLAQQGLTILVTTHYMDEAEYCDRVGLMVDGRLAALDTPHGLKQTYVPGHIHAVRNAAPAAAQGLGSLPGVLHVEPFGAGFHVRVAENGPGAAQLRQALQQAGQAEVLVETQEASLEDVFLEVVKANTRAADTVAVTS